MKQVRSICASLVASVLIAGIVGCGGGGASVAVHVGSTPIATATVTHWMAVIATEHYVPDPPSYTGCIHRHEALEPAGVKAGLKPECEHQYEELRQRALAFLISSQWIIGEAARQGIRTSSAEVAQSLESASKPAILQNGGASAADERFAAEAELAAGMIRRKLIGGEPAITQVEVGAYYRRNIARFQHPERREIHIAEHIQSTAEARKLRQEVLSGKKDLSKIGLHELVHERDPFNAVPGKTALAKAIFAARPHVVSPLLSFDLSPVFFEVVHVTPAYTQPLAQVRSSIEAQLAVEQRRQTLARFINVWRRRWTARTNCAPGYVLQKCRQYRGRRTPEEPLTLS